MKHKKTQKKGDGTGDSKDEQDEDEEREEEEEEGNVSYSSHPDMEERPVSRDHTEARSHERSDESVSDCDITDSGRGLTEVDEEIDVVSDDDTPPRNILRPIPHHHNH